MQSYYIKNTKGQSYCVYLEYRDFKTKILCSCRCKSYTGKILAKDNVITEQNIVNNCW